MSNTETITRICENSDCRKEFFPTRSQVTRGVGRFCCRACGVAGRREGGGRPPVAPDKKVTRIVLHGPPHVAQWISAQEWAHDPVMQRKESKRRNAEAVALLVNQEFEGHVL